MKSAWLQSRRVQWMKGLKEVQIHKQSSSGQRCPRLGRKRTFKVFLFDFNTRNSCQIKVCLICCRKKRLMFTTCAPFTPFASPLRGSICNKKKGGRKGACIQDEERTFTIETCAPTTHTAQKLTMCFNGRLISVSSRTRTPVDIALFVSGPFTGIC